MTTRAGRRPRGASVIAEFGLTFSRQAQRLDGKRWPSTKWQKDPVGFAYFILGVSLWSFQVTLLEAIRDHRHVAVAGGRKIGKDFAVAVAALWWYASFEDARVFMLAPSGKQLDGIVYRDIQKLFARAGRCVDCRRSNPTGPTPCQHSAILTGKVGSLARTGITAPDLREIKGQTAIGEGGLRGFSGAKILAIEDEASDIKDDFDRALVGNLAGEDCHRVAISNPTRATGFFFDAFHAQREIFHCIQQSSLDNPNLKGQGPRIPGLADAEWVRERAIAWGRESPEWKANVEGRFVYAEQGQIFTAERVHESEDRHETTAAHGRLHIGIDVAGGEEGSDESAFAWRRGQKQLGLVARRLPTPEGHLVEALAIIAGCPTPGEDIPRIVIDRGAEIGAKVWGVFVAHLDAHPDAFDLVGVFSSDRAVRMPHHYDRVRDELAASLADWMREGGAILTDLKLQRELTAQRWDPHFIARSKMVQKKEIRRLLGRSPDRFDATCLMTWGPRYEGATAEEPGHEARAEETQPDPYDAETETTFDPYVSAFDPYAGLGGSGGADS